MSALAGIADSWNPILVKEVRAALRGRVFRILFPIVVLGATLISMMVLAALDPAREAEVGKEFLGPIYFMLCVALLGIVPLTAFFSMGSEWEENTYDLLSISNLRPRHIVFGKLFSAGVEATLYFSAFAPLIVFAFLLRGVDIVALLSLLGLTYCASFAASALALAFSSLVRVRFARIFVLCIVAAGLVGVIALAFNFAAIVVLRRWGGSSGLGLQEFSIALAFIVACLFTGTTIACERLAHNEENHSSGPRALVTVLFVSWLAIWLSTVPKGVSSSWVLEPVMVALLLSGCAHAFFVTEREEMSHRTARGVPGRWWAALLVAPFMPGGGRALLLFGLHFVLALVLVVVELESSASAGSHGSLAVAGSLKVGLFAAHLFAYLAIISWLTHRHAEKPLSRWLTRLAIPTAVVLAVCVPAFASYMFAGRRYPDFDHVLNPFYLAFTSHSRPSAEPAALALVVTIALLVNAGRIVHGIREVLAASKHNRERAEAG